LLGVLSVLSPGAAGAIEITVLAGMGVVSEVLDVAPAFERATGHKVIVSFEAGRGRGAGTANSGARCPRLYRVQRKAR
jgi:ABC-type molybdate transport system substrate-binding protein